jgi:hypothetical protein
MRMFALVLLSLTACTACTAPTGLGPLAPPVALACAGCASNPMPTSTYPERIDITWVDGDADASVRVLKNGVVVETVAHGVQAYSFLGLTSDTEYTFGVQHIENGQLNPPGGPVTIVIRTLKGTLGAPQSLVAQTQALASIKLTWAPGTDGAAASYVIERSPNGSSGWTQIGTTGAGVTQFTHQSFADAEDVWFFRVKAQRTNWNDSPVSSTASTAYGTLNQFARPIVDITVGGFTSSDPSGRLWSELDEEVSDNNTTQVAKTCAAGTHTYEVKLGQVDVFDSAQEIVIRVAHRKIGSSGVFTPTISLYEGATLRATTTPAPLLGSWRVDVLTLTPGERAAISDPTNLRVRVAVSHSEGYSINYRGSWIEMENNTP